MTSKTEIHSRGLANIGNTCYLNSAVQALRHTRVFKEMFGSEAWKCHEHPERRGHALATAFSEIMRAFADTETDKPIGPFSLVRAFVGVGQEFNDEIRFGAQADAAEALQIIIDCLHTYLSREVRMDISGSPKSGEMQELVNAHTSWIGFFRKEYSAFLDQFYGQTQTCVTCDGCKNRSIRYAPWCVLKIPIPGGDRVGAPAPTLQECIAAAFEKETLDDYMCDACSVRGPAMITHAISQFPECLILTLKRFTNAGAKVRARIPYDPDAVTMRPCSAWKTIPVQADYTVTATIEHMGSSRGGHYYMRQRVGDEWLVMDDASVYPSPHGGAAGPDTYVLFLSRSAK